MPGRLPAAPERGLKAPRLPKPLGLPKPPGLSKAPGPPNAKPISLHIIAPFGLYLPDPFQAVKRRSLRVVLALVADVSLHPIQVAGPETDHPVPRLPLEQLAATPHLLVDFVGGSPFDLTDQIADEYRRRDRYDHVDVRFGSTDLVDKKLLQC